MNNYEQLIDKLAAKLSVPAAHLWRILVQQARVEAVSSVVAFGLSLVFLAVMVKLTPRMVGYINGNDYDDEGAASGVFLLGIVGWIACTIFTIATAIGAYNAIGYWLNPEYYALRQVLDAVK